VQVLAVDIAKGLRYLVGLHVKQLGLLSLFIKIEVQVKPKKVNFREIF
jgi:hypothetical protein